MSNMPNAPAMIPMSIPDPAFVKRKAFLVQGADYNHYFDLSIG